ncbi:unnamed protein product, partial [Rotaria sp. Silwood2]
SGYQDTSNLVLFPLNNSNPDCQGHSYCYEGY